MTVDLNQCDKACYGCIKSYGAKHDLVRGDKFKISCTGIPKNYIAPSLLQILPAEEAETAKSLADPVAWAARNLDWHCLDLDGEIWKRKNPEEYWDWMKKNPGGDITGRSRYHRPYQAEMLRCTAKNKIFRIGRQAGKTETMVVAMLFHLFTKPGKSEEQGFGVLIVTPFQAQIELIFGRLNELLSSSTELTNSIARTVKAPNYTIELKNRSTVRGFTAGTQSGGNANSIRGQHGDMLVFDEADYLDPGDIDSAMAVTTNSPNATVWMSSTPSGKRERFYINCHSKLWKEFYYPSMVNPMWTAEKEEQYRETLTEIAYKHEILADFGEQEEGVFQNVYVQAAKKNHYKYGDMPWDPMWVYTVGVDWNDVKNGTTIAVTGYNPNTNHFFIVDRHIISREGWTQMAACQKIVELNRTWKPAAIYIDKGFGGTQYEVLKKYSWDSLKDPTKGATHPDAKMKDVLHQYDFGSKIEIHDLFTKQPIEKQAKSFLVENAVRRFESQMISFPDADKALEEQLAGYIIDRITPTGVPVYKAANEAAGDHLLDAVMLALVAFTLQKTPFGVPRIETGIAFSGGIGQRIEPDIHKGDTIVQNDRREDPRADHRPEMKRTDAIVEKQPTLLGSTGSDLPANHVKQGATGVKSWLEGGFSHDGPMHKIRTLTEAVKEAEKRLGIGRMNRNKPRRKNI